MPRVKCCSWRGSFPRWSWFGCFPLSTPGWCFPNLCGCFRFPFGWFSCSSFPTFSYRFFLIRTRPRMLFMTIIKLWLPSGCCPYPTCLCSCLFYPLAMFFPMRNMFSSRLPFRLCFGWFPNCSCCLPIVYLTWFRYLPARRRRLPLWAGGFSLPDFSSCRWRPCTFCCRRLIPSFPFIIRVYSFFRTLGIFISWFISMPRTLII